MSEKTPARPKRVFYRVPILFALVAIWVLMLAAVLVPVSESQASSPLPALRGGRLYVAWDQVTNTSLSGVDPSPLWPTDTPNQVPAILTLRCVSCHGWDYSGSDGRTLGAIFRNKGYPGLLKFTGQPLDEIIPALVGEINPAHDYSEWLTEQDLEDLAAFISKGMVVPELIADPLSYEVQGIPDRGREPYIEYCSSCHGFEGERINMGTDGRPAFLGDIGWNNPWLMVHIIRFGHITAQVPAAKRLGISFSQTIDIAAFTQTLPDAEFIAGPDYEDIDLSAQASTTDLAYGAVAITALIYLAVGITLWWDKKHA